MATGTPDGGGPRPPGARRRTLAPLAVVGWVVLEIWLLTLVAGAIGGGWVLLILLAGAVFGGLAVQRAGRRAWSGLTATLRAGVPGAPERPAGPGDRADGGTDRAAGTERAARPGGGAVTAMLGGVLLMVPGLLSDVAGLLCLFPPTRRLLAAAARGLARRRARRGFPAGTFGDAFRQARMRMPDGKVVPGEVVRDGSAPGRDRGGAGGPGDEGPRPPLTR